MNRKLLGGLLVACLIAPLSMALAEDVKLREVVSFRKFKEAFPEKLGELVRNSNTGETSTIGDMTTSKADAKYAKDKDGAEPTVELSVVDFNNPAMIQAMSMMVKMNISKETDDSWQKTLKIDGQPAMLEYNIKDKNGKYTVVIADRFLLTVDANGIAEDDFKKLGDKLPLKALADLAK